MKERRLKIIQNIIYSLILPVITFIIVNIIVRSKGNSDFGNWYSWKMILTNAALSVCLASVLGLNLKNGRMDLSSGANMILTGILATTITKSINGNGIVLLLLCILFGILFSAVTATVYITLKMPMVITAIGMVLLYESLTKIINGGGGANIVSTSSLNYWCKIPYAYILAAIALLIYMVVTKYSIIGYESGALTSNQSVAVNVGINEKRTVFSIFICSGVILGMGSAIYVTGNIVAAQGNLESVGIVYSNFLPIITGLYLAKYSNDAIGILIGAITISIIKYGINLLGMGEWQNIIIGIFILLFCLFTSNKMDQFMKKIKRKKVVV